MSPVINSLQNAGFQLPSRDVQQRMILSLCGRRGKGKSHFALTAPGPIALFDLDVGLDGVVQKFLDDKVVMVNRFEVPYTKEAAEAERDRFYAAWSAAIRARDIRTIIVDTETELWELYRMAEYGALSGVMPYQYTAVNVRCARLFKETLTVGLDKNFIFLRHLKTVYVNDKKTDRMEPAGFGGLEKIVQVVGEIWRDIPEEGGEWHVTIDKCRLNPEVDGETYDGDMASFPWLATFVVNGTSPADWGWKG